MVRFDKLGYSLSILFVDTLGDSVFWEHHCVSCVSCVSRVSRVSWVSWVSWVSGEGYTTFTSPSTALGR